MMRVAVVIDSLRIGGAQRLVAAFAAAACAYHIQPVIINLKPATPSVVLDTIQTAGVRVISVPSPTLFSIKRLRWLVNFLKEEKIDLVQCHLMYANILGSVAAHLAGVPVACTLHSTHARRGWKEGLLKKVEDYCLRLFATRIVAVGDMVATAHQGRYGDCIVDVIPNGIPEPGAISTSDRERLRNEFAADGRPIIITVGRFTSAKGYEDMVEAFKLLCERNLKSVLLMVGAGSTQDTVRMQIQKLGLEQSVVLTGERRDIPQLLASSDVFVSSSHWEGLPLSILEAMMAGLPVVATSVGDIPKVVTEETGIIVPPHQPEQLATALAELLMNRVKRAAMGKAAKERAVNQYSVDVWMKRHVALYNSMISTQKLQSVQ